MNFDIRLAPKYLHLQKNIPKYKLSKYLDDDGPQRYHSYTDYINDIKDCVDLKGESDNAEIKSFVSFNIKKPDSYNVLSHLDYHYVETTNKKFNDNIDTTTKFDMTHIKNILHSYESVITFNQFFWNDKYNYICVIIIMICCNKNMSSKDIESDDLKIHKRRAHFHENDLKYEFNNLKNDFAELKNEFMLLKKKLSKCGK